jgi:hypothetical protein
MRIRNTWTSGRLLFAALIGLAAVEGVAVAQTSGSPYEPEIQQLVLEVKVDLANVRPAFDSELSALIASGPYELRVRIDNWNPRGRNYRLSAFLVAPGSPLPTPQVPESTSSTMIVQAAVRMESIFHVKYADSGPGVAFAGRVFMKFGGIAEIEPGEVWMFGFAYPSDVMERTSPAQTEFKHVTLWSPNSINVFSPTASGSILVAPPRN